MQQRWVRERPAQHPIGDDVVGLVGHVDAVPVGEITRVTPNNRRLVARPAGVVRAIAAAACNQRITNACPVQNK